jgi:CRP-like cAMP-binding protein
MNRLHIRRSSEDKLKTLRQIPLFAPAGQRELTELAAQCTLHTFRKGHIFYRPEDRSQTVYMLTDGRVALYRLRPDGKKLTIDVLGAGALFDDLALLNDNIHHTFAEAAEHCTALVIDRVALRHFVMRTPHVLLNVMQHVTQRIHSMEENLERMAFHGIPARLSHLLLELAQTQGSNTVIGFTHQELAERVGTYRETATQILNSLRSEGYIDIGRRQIAILQPDQLAAVAGLY